MLAELEAGRRWHGVYLALHGAMGVRGVARPEADIARRVREVVGRDAFVAGTFRSAWQRGRRVPEPGRLRVLRQILPALRQLPAGRARGSHADPRNPRRLHPRHRDGQGADPDRDGAAVDWRFTVDGRRPARLIWEAREPDLYMNVFFGFPFADVSDVGMTVQ